MSDKIFLGSDIPDGYNYAVYNNSYITLYNKPSAQGETLTYYRIYFPYSSDLVSTGQTTFSNYSRTYFEQVQTSREFFDRPDAYKIVFNWFVVVFCCIWLFNLITSIIRKGGLLGGLF